MLTAAVDVQKSNSSPTAVTPISIAPLPDSEYFNRVRFEEHLNKSVAAD